MSKVDNPNERVLGANNLVVTSYIEEEQIIKLKVRFIQGGSSRPVDIIPRVDISYNVDLDKVDTESFYNVNPALLGNTYTFDLKNAHKYASGTLQTVAGIITCILDGGTEDVTMFSFNAIDDPETIKAVVSF